VKKTIAIGLIALAVLAVAGLLAGSGRGQNKDAAPKADKKEPPTSRQVLMRDKLTYANKALDGLSVEDFAKIAESGKMMRMISKAASWYVIPTDEYLRFSKNFQEQAQDLELHANEKNLDAAALDYMRITMTCVQCHKYMREVRSKEQKQ
jgi:hypothetical protein